MTRKFLSRKVQDILQSGGNTPLTIEEIFSKLDEDCTMGTLKSVLNGMVDHHKDYLGSSKDIAYYKVNNSKGYFKKR
ncbi:hypothetical protein [Apilactobacillus ozensis]|uniref:hypothetical protein n=1 Tax=Apilactobacillus ozensis TaxID=866801 RepID=UPI0006CFFC82|nr:hypothetical protein [Apilactobacillus ozensis]